MQSVANSATGDDRPEQFVPRIDIPSSGVSGMTALPVDLLTDGTLSFDARGLLAYLCSLPRPVTLPEMVAASTDGTHMTRRALDELLHRGLVAVIR